MKVRRKKVEGLTTFSRLARPVFPYFFLQTSNF